MKNNIGYSGINSVSFVKGFNPVTREFDKSKLPSMRFPGRIYLNTPKLVLKVAVNVSYQTIVLAT